MQIPCGFFFDRYGPRLTVFGMLLLAVLGGAVFTLAPGWPVLLTGRALMGAGFGVMLIGSMVVISRWFPPDRFSTLSAMVMSIGLIGNLLATTPLAWAAEAIGWRSVFAVVVAFTALAAGAVWLIVRDAPPGHPFLERRTEPPREMLAGLMEVLRNRNLPFILALSFCNYACTFTVQGLWGGPFLREVYGMSKIQAGNVLMAAVFAYQFGMLVFGPLDRLFDTRKRIAATGSLIIAGILGTLAVWSAARVAAGRRDHRHWLLQRVQHDGNDPWARHLSRPADRPRYVHDEHHRHARRCLHADSVGRHPGSVRTSVLGCTVGNRLSFPVRRRTRR